MPNEPNLSPTLSSAVFKKREEQWLHVPYEAELHLLDLVKNGAVEELEFYMHDIRQRIDWHDHLCQNALRQRMYEFVATITLVTRWAVEGGLDVETAYSLADAYIGLADGFKTQEEILSLFIQAPTDYAGYVREAKKKKSFSRHVLQCVEFIESNLHYPITLEDLGKRANLNPSYLATLFKKEVGETVVSYIIGKRLNAAKEMLSRSNEPVSQIAYTLGFNSQSYFSAVFRKREGITPNEYRVKHFRQHDAGS
ncbi:MAG: AraC family transcriptional regulator [Clostridiales bacterium]|nr:AraC family transcriptional regulator [Clostridiales bacterium]